MNQWSHAAHRRRTSAARTVQRCLRIALCVPALLALATAAQAQSRNIEHFFDEFTAQWVRHDPDLATATRYFSGPEQDALEQQLTPNTRVWDLQRIQLARQGLKRAAWFEQAKLTDAQRVSADLMRWQLEIAVNAEPYLDYRFPLEQFGGANVQLVESLTLRHPLATAKDASQLHHAPRPRRRAHGRGGRRSTAPGGQGHDPAALHRAVDADLDAHVQRRAGASRIRWSSCSCSAFPASRHSARNSARSWASRQRESWRPRCILRGDVPSSCSTHCSQRPPTMRACGASRVAMRPTHLRWAASRRRTLTRGADSPDRPAAGRAHRRARWTRSCKQLGRTEGSVRERIGKLQDDLRYPDPTSDASRAAIMRDIDGYMQDALKRSPTLVRPAAEGPPSSRSRSRAFAKPAPRRTTTARRSTARDRRSSRCRCGRSA